MILNLALLTKFILIMEREEEDNYSASMELNNYTSMDFSLDQQEENHQQQQLIRPRVLFGENSNENRDGIMVNYMFNNNTLPPPPAPPPPPPQLQQQISSSTSLDRLSFAEVMQFADFGSKLGLNQKLVPTHNNKILDGEGSTARLMDDPVYFLKFPVLSDRLQQEEDDDQNVLLLNPSSSVPTGNYTDEVHNEEDRFDNIEDHEEGEEEEGRIISENNNGRVCFLGSNLHDNNQKKSTQTSEVVTIKNRRKRLRSVKTSEEVESQRMTHIAVERNRRKQMNEHLRVLRSLMPGSYVQRGDQASIIGGAIEFVRELEQLLQCLESQKRRRLYGGTDSSSSIGPSGPSQQPPQLFHAQPNMQSLPSDHMMKLVDIEQTGLHEETAENKSCLADIEVKLLGMDAMIKILSRRRPGQLLKTIAAFEDLQLNILHTNITTIEQTVLYSFNVKVGGETRFTAEDIATSVQQIFSFIHASTTL